MESKGGKKSSSSRSSLMYEAPLGYSIEDLRPAGGIEKFRSAAYSNVCITSIELLSFLVIAYLADAHSFNFQLLLFCSAPGSHPDNPFRVPQPNS
jgi:hypothetical protein